MAYILVVDDEKKMRHLLSMMLERKGYKVDQAGDGVEALEILKESAYDMIICDIKMPRLDGIGLLDRIRQEKKSCPVVFITAFATVDSAVEAMRRGAVDYITKPFDEERILLTVERTLNVSRIMAENRDLKLELNKVAGSNEIIYKSESMARIMDLAGKVARSDTVVLISGESGTGKELLARFVHRESARKNDRFVPINCAAISPNLVESELFGHEKGAFTGADRKAVGKFEFATGGTLFLDEIGDLPMEAQAKLLRALQEKMIQRVGGNEEIPVDVRFICATNQNLERLVDKGMFRQDLYFRINVFPIHLPLLRERTEDIAPLAGHFLEHRCAATNTRLSSGAMNALGSYSWPGNVRELANAMERSAILTGNGGLITASTLSFLKDSATFGSGDGNFQLPPEGISLEELEKKLAQQAMKITGQNQTAAAELLGLSRAKFRGLLKQIIEGEQD